MFNALKAKLMPVATIAIALTGWSLAANPAKSAILSLVDDNATAALETDSANNPINSGLLFWTVDDRDRLFQNQYWYRVGSTGGESVLSSLNLTGVTQTAPNKISLGYAGIGFEIGIDYLLDGGADGSGRSSLTQNISIRNTGSSLLDFHLFNYTDLDLDAAGDDTAIIGQNGARVFDSLTSAREVVTKANRYQVSPIFDILNGLTDNNPTDLSNLSGPLTGDSAYAFQWDFNLASSEIFSISSTKYISPVTVPEPATILGALAFGSFAMFKRSRLAKYKVKARN